jgi:hypothetical protein
VRQVLEAIVVARQPLTEEQLAAATGLDAETELARLLRRLDAFVPRRDGGYAVFHQSLTDWLTHEEMRGETYYVSRRRGHGRLAEVGLVEWRRGTRRMSRYALRHLPAHLLGAERWDELVAVLMTPSYLEAKTEASLVVELADDFLAASQAQGMPADQPRRPWLELLEEAVRYDAPFLTRHPTALFQSVWNTAWWYDCDEAERHYVLPDDEAARAALPWRQAGEKLSGWLEGWRAEKEQETPGFVWVRSLRPPTSRLQSGLRAIFRGHELVVADICWSPDGKRLASGSCDQTVRVWDAASGAQLLCLEGHEKEVLAVSWSADGRRLASASVDGTVRVWDVASGAQLQLLRLEGHEKEVLAVSWSADGKRLATASRDKTVRVWDAASGAQLLCLQGHADWVEAVNWSADGRRLASASVDKTVRVWNSETGACLHIIEWTMDLAAVLGDVAGPSPLPSRTNVHETELRSISSDRPVAWYSRPINLVTCPTSDRLFAGKSGNHVYLLRLEGDL